MKDDQQLDNQLKSKLYRFKIFILLTQLTNTENPLDLCTSYISMYPYEINYNNKVYYLHLKCLHKKINCKSNKQSVM